MLVKYIYFFLSNITFKNSGQRDLNVHNIILLLVEYIGENDGFYGSGDRVLIEWFGQCFRKLRIMSFMGICVEFS